MQAATNTVKKRLDMGSRALADFFNNKTFGHSGPVKQFAVALGVAGTVVPAFWRAYAVTITRHFFPSVMSRPPGLPWSRASTMLSCTSQSECCGSSMRGRTGYLRGCNLLWPSVFHPGGSASQALARPLGIRPGIIANPKVLFSPTPYCVNSRVSCQVECLCHCALHIKATVENIKTYFFRTIGPKRIGLYGLQDLKISYVACNRHTHISFHAGAGGGGEFRILEMSTAIDVILRHLYTQKEPDKYISIYRLSNDKYSSKFHLFNKNK